MNEEMSCRKIPFPLFDNISIEDGEEERFRCVIFTKYTILCHHNKQSAVDLLHRISVCLSRAITEFSGWMWAK